MRRRTMLASIASLAAAAGCVNRGPDPGARPAESDTPTESPSPTDVHTHTRTATETPLRPDPATDAFADVACPSFDDHADETVCYHAADAETADLLLTAEPEVFVPDDGDETLAFVCYNRSDWPVSFNPYAWGIERYESADGSWTHVAPDVHPEPMTELAPGATTRWVLPTDGPPETVTDGDSSVTDDGTGDGGDDGSGDDSGEVYPLSVDLDPGVYAFHLTVRYGGLSSDTPTDAPKPAERVELVALFELEESIAPDGGTATETTGEDGE